MDNEMANNFRDWERYIRITRRFTATEVARQADHDASWLARWEKLPKATILEPWQYLKIRDYIAPDVPMRSLVKTAPMRIPFLDREQRKKAAEILERTRIAKCVANFTLSTKIGLSASSWAYLISIGGAPAESTIYLACKVLSLDYKELLKEVGVDEPEEYSR
ncbi:hypothetical protein [Acidaminococcus fermentans]|uniref:hypothetical protein n=1 Tax=Acidaminococcus fermentans TaxID=905 RepID=UPI0026601438|nr:hypothetical protein [Acidaminococcus fermentans]